MPTAADFRPYADALVLRGTPHADYARCAALAAEYRALATGDGLGQLLRRYEARETQQEYDGRLRLTEFLTPAIWSQLLKAFVRVARLRQGVTRRFDYADNTPDPDGRRTRLVAALEKFDGLSSLEDYLGTVTVETTGDTDPNAWLVTDFAPFDYRREQPRPLPVVVPCEAAWDFTQDGGAHTSLTVKTPWAGASRYTVYLANETITYYPFVTENGQPQSTRPESLPVAWTVTGDTSQPAFEAVVTRHRAGRLPAERLGYVPDRVTSGRTCVSLLHPALPYLRKTLKLGSEADITAAQVVHPHKAQYALACPGVEDKGCGDSGRDRDGNVCGLCHGTHINPTQTGAGDVLQLPYPKDAEPKDIVDLSKLVVWNAPPTDIVKMQDELLEKYQQRAHQAVFNSDQLVKVTVTGTATEYQDRKDELNNTLAPYAQSLSRLYRSSALVVAAYQDAADGLSVTYRHPADLKLRSEAELNAALKSAVDSGAPAPVREALALEMVEKVFVDNPLEVLKYKVKMRFTPFQGLSDETVLRLQAVGQVLPEYMALRFYQDSIFAEIEQQQGMDFYRLAETAQQALVDTAVQKILQQMSATQVTAAAPFGRLAAVIE